MKRFPSLVLAGAALFPAALTAAPFEGRVTMTVTTSGAATQKITYRTKDNLVRIDIDAGPRASPSIIVDTATQQMTILLPQQSMYMVRPISSALGPRAAAQGEAEGGELTKTGETAKILGYDCVKYTVKSSGGSAELWVTDQLGSFVGLGGGVDARRGRPAAAWEDAIKGKNFFPLKVIAESNDTEMRMEATAVHLESLPASDFVPPPGWKNIGASLQGMLPGDRPPRN